MIPTVKSANPRAAERVTTKYKNLSSITCESPFLYWLENFREHKSNEVQTIYSSDTVSRNTRMEFVATIVEH